MSDDRAFERATDDWLADGSDRTPASAVDAVLLAIKTTPQERDLGIPWRTNPMSNRFRLAAVAVIAVIAVGVLALNLPRAGGVGGPGSSPSPSPSSSPSSLTVFDTRTIATHFPLAMKVSLPAGWKTIDDGIVGALGIVHTGDPEGPQSTWWGADLFLVEEAQIHDPSDVVSNVPAKPDRTRFVAWPTDFFAYIAALPGVTVVSGPEPVNVGGVTGTQIVVMTPPMHPLVWLKGDFAWMGGGATGVDPAQERRFVIVTTGGHTLFVQFGDDASTFDERDAEVRAILASITFE